MEDRKNSMLETAYKCFQSASTCGEDCNEEEWLIHYMLGKISEKRKLPPKDYLKLFKQVNYWSTPVQHNSEGVVPYGKGQSLNGSFIICAWIYKANEANIELLTVLTRKILACRENVMYMQKKKKYVNVLGFFIAKLFLQKLY